MDKRLYKRSRLSFLNLSNFSDWRQEHTNRWLVVKVTNYSRDECREWGHVYDLVERNMAIGRELLNDWKADQYHLIAKQELSFRNKLVRESVQCYC